MYQQAPEPAHEDTVQVFDVAQALENHEQGRVDMATSPNSFIAVFRSPPSGGEKHIHQHPDSDQILFILKGECTVVGVSDRYVLTPNQGVLIPAGVHYGFQNLTQDDLVFLSMRTESTGGRRVGFVANVASDVDIKIPAEALDVKAGGGRFYVYALDYCTIGISPGQIQEWNRSALLRVFGTHERAGDDIKAILPERVARWYGLADLAESDYRLIFEPDRTRVRVDLSPLLKRRATSGAFRDGGL